LEKNNPSPNNVRRSTSLLASGSGIMNQQPLLNAPLYNLQKPLSNDVSSIRGYTPQKNENNYQESPINDYNPRVDLSNYLKGQQ
jgi:hypothetical protein